MADASYVFAGEQDRGFERFAALAALYDDATKRYIDALGVDRGATCLEIGAGGGSIARWLAERSSPGRVVATDRDTSYLARAALKGVELQQHDIDADVLPEGAFDLVHARLVVMHLSDVPAAIGRMVRALKPAGWLIVEEFDATGVAGGPGKVLQTGVAFRSVLEKSGV